MSGSATDAEPRRRGAPGTTLYCAGLPLDGERLLSGDERGRARALRRRHGARALARLALAPAGLAASVLVAAWTRGASGTAAQVLAASAMLALGLVVPIAALLQAVRAAAAWRALGADLSRGVALRFAAGGRSVAVLPRSGLALEWDGVPAAPGPPLAVGEAAVVPAEVATYAVDVGTARAAPGLDVVRRALSGSEREEIADHARRLARVPAILAVFSATFVLLAARVLRGPEPAPSGAGALVAVWAASLAFSWWRYLRARSLARKLREDVSNGWALRATAGGPAGSEVLAVSGASWTVHGAPAPWRTRCRRGVAR